MTTNLSPFVVSEAQEVELSAKDGTKKKFWKKQILPSGTRKYKDQTLDFSKINPACVKAFDEDATGAGVPFVLAMPDNTHPKTGEEAKQMEGDLSKLELAKDGSLYGYFDLTNSKIALDAIKKSNGKFGVSGRIEVEYTRNDTGAKYDYALSHVCGTTRPHVKGLTPWEAVELSEEEKKSEVIDFSTDVIADEIDSAINDKVNEGGDGGDMPFTADEVTAFRQMLADQKAAQDAIDQMGKPKDEGVKLTEADNKRIELAEANARKGFELAEKAQIELATARWEARKAALVREGVPPVILAEAERVLKLHKRPTIDLTDDDGAKQTIDAAEVIEKMLDACKGVVDLSAEQGNGLSDPASSAAKEFKAFEESFFADFNK